MKFSLWLEKRVRNQKSQTKIPKAKTDVEKIVSDAGMRTHLMTGHGQFKTYGKAGRMDHNRNKGSRSEKNRQAMRDQE